MGLTRRGLLMGALASAALPSAAVAGGHRVDALFDGFDVLERNGRVKAFDGFESLDSFWGADRYLAVYFGAAREVERDCIADVDMMKDVLVSDDRDGLVTPVLVIPKPRDGDNDRAFLENFRELQGEVERAVVLMHDDPEVVKRLSINSGVPYALGPDGVVESHGRKLSILDRGGNRCEFGDDKTLGVETFRHYIQVQTFEANIANRVPHRLLGEKTSALRYSDVSYG